MRSTRNDGNRLSFRSGNRSPAACRADSSTPVQRPACRRGHRDAPRDYDSRAKHSGESYFFFAPVNATRRVDGVKEKNGGIRRAFLRTRSSSMSKGSGRRKREREDRREEMICGGGSAGNRQLVSIPTGSCPPPLPRKRFACLKMDAQVGEQGDTRRNYLMRHGDASSRASVTITKALQELLWRSLHASLALIFLEGRV